VRLLASIQNKYIIAYKEAFYDEDSKSLCVIMEYAGGGDILQKIQRYRKKHAYISESLIWRYFLHILRGLKTLHDMDILHRDLKCANIFISKDGRTAKLGDLNVSKVARDGLVRT